MLTPDTLDQTNSTGATPTHHAERAAQLAELRRDLAAIVADVAQVVEQRAAQMKDGVVDGAEAGLDATRQTIRSYPLASLGAAALLGAAVAVMLTPTPQRSSGLSRLSGRLSDWTPDVTRADLDAMARRLQRSVSQAANGSSLASTFERVIDSVSSIDAKSSLTPALEKAGAWLSSMRGAIGGK